MCREYKEVDIFFGSIADHGEFSVSDDLSTVNNEGLSYTDFVHAPVGSNFDAALDEEPTGLKVDNGTPITFVLKLGYFFPESSIAVHPVKAIVLV